MIRVFCVLIVALLIAAPAAAQDMAQWEDYLSRASEAYDAQDYEAALLLYGKAQEIVDSPRLQLQIADIHERLEECNAARLIYVKIMDAPQIDQEIRQSAGERLEGLSTCGVETPEPGEVEADVAPTEQLPLPEASPDKAQRRLPPGRKRAGLLFVTAGGANLVAGFLFAGAFFLPATVKQCLGIKKPTSCEQRAAELGVSNIEARDDSDAVRGTHVGAAVAFGIGGVLAIGTGVILLTTGKRPVALIPTTTGVQLIARF